MPRGVPKHFEKTNYFDRLLGRHYRRKRGTVVYEVIGGWADFTYQRSYNFVNYFVRLRRVGTNRTTSVFEHTFNHGFREINEAPTR